MVRDYGSGTKRERRKVRGATCLWDYGSGTKRTASARARVRLRERTQATGADPRVRMRCRGPRERTEDGPVAPQQRQQRAGTRGPHAHPAVEGAGRHRHVPTCCAQESELEGTCRGRTPAGGLAEWTKKRMGKWGSICQKRRYRTPFAKWTKKRMGTGTRNQQHEEEPEELSCLVPDCSSRLRPFPE
jgi:hypothetical protein